MKRFNKILSIVLVLSLMLPGIASATSVESNNVEKTSETSEVIEAVAEEKTEEPDELHTGNNPDKQEEVEKTEETIQVIEKTEATESGEILEMILDKAQTENILDGGNQAQETAISTLALKKEVKRINGNNRIETAIKVSSEAYKGKVETVLLAGYDGAADALTATFVAGQKDAPLLLTHKSQLDPKLLAELKRLNPDEIVILGGQNVIGKDIENGLKKAGYNIKRIQGNSRVETAINVASEYYEYKSGLSSASEVFVIEYNSLVDALAIGPVAARDGVPILIIRKDNVPSEVAKYLKEKNIKKATIIGGTSKISEKAKSQLENLGMTVGRISGDNRILTSINICTTYFKNRNATIVANGVNYTDALIGGYFAAKMDAPIILTNDSTIPNEALHCIKEGKTTTFVLGGESVISYNMYNAIKNTVNPKPKPAKPIVCLDYGHGGKDSGAVLRDENNNVIRKEKDDIIVTGKAVATELRRHGVEVDETRKGDEYLTLTERVNIANQKNYNYFVSFHRNSASTDKANGVEVFTTANSSAKDLAKSLQSNLVDVGFTDRGTKYANFTVISKTKAPAALMEIGFIINEKDNEIFDTKQKEIVRAITSAILGELGINYKN